MFKEVLILLRTLNLLYHQAHNVASGPSFVGDHELLNTFYLAADKDYDDVAERLVGLTGSFSRDMLVEVIKESAEILSGAPEGAINDYFSFALQLESELCAELAKASVGQSEGSKQLLGEAANQSEMRQYKIKQRLK